LLCFALQGTEEWSLAFIGIVDVLFLLQV